MTRALASLAKQYRFNERMLATIVDDFSPEEWHRRYGPANPAIWLVGHLAASRRGLLRLLGVALPKAEWEALYAMGAEVGDTGGYPQPRVLADDFRARGEDLEAHLSSMSEERAASGCKAFPDGTATLEGAARFHYMHESYHLGQLGYLRRLAGKKGFV